MKQNLYLFYERVNTTIVTHEGVFLQVSINIYNIF